MAKKQEDARDYPSLDELAKRDHRFRFRIDHDLGTVVSLRGDLGEIEEVETKQLRSATTRLLRRHGDLFGGVKSTGLRQLLEADDPHGGLTLTLQQYHGKARVIGGSWRVHATRKGMIDSLDNRLFADLDKLPEEPKVHPYEAVDPAVKATNARRG